MDDPSFDPYYRWLAIPPAEQPPNCYRLLGLALFEADLDVIASAADRQMGHLRTYQNGPYSHFSQRLLNEVSQARLTLLQPHAKAQYDHALRAKLYPPTSVTATRPSTPADPPAHLVTPSVVTPPPKPSIAFASSAPSASLDDVSASTNSAQRARRSPSSGLRQFIGIVFGGLAGCLLGAVILTLVGVELPGGFRLYSKREVTSEPPTLQPIRELPQPEIEAPTPPSESLEQSPATRQAFSQIPAEIDPWGTASSQHFLFTPGTYSLKYAERGERAFFDIYRQTSSSSQRAGSMGLADCLRRQDTIQHSFDRQLHYHFYYVKPQSAGKLVLCLNAASDALFDGPGEICILGRLSGGSANQHLTLAAYREFDLSTMSPLPTSTPLAEKEFRCSLRDGQYADTHLISTLKFVANQQPNLYLVIELQGGNGDNVVAAEWKLHNEVPSHYRPQGATTVRFTTIPRPAGFADNSNRIPAPLSPADGRPAQAGTLTSLPLPEEFERLLRLHEQNFSSTDPQAWLTRAQQTPDSADRKAIFLLAARQAANQGNLVLLEQIFSLFQQETREDLATFKLPLLVTLAAAPNKTHSPASFAAVAYDALQKQLLNANSVEASKLLTLAKTAAAEAGDVRLQQALARLEKTNPGSSTEKPAAVVKAAALDKIKLDEARALIKDLFAKDLEKADTAEKRRQVALKMQALAHSTPDDPAARYVLLHEAATLLTRFDSPDAWDAWEQLTKEFGVPVISGKMTALDALQKKARLSNEYRLLASRYLTLLAAAIEDDSYREAELASSRAETTAKKANDKLLERIVALRSKDIPAMKKAFESAKSNRDTLQSQPNDAAAALNWGRYLCWYRGQWEIGLPLLAKGSDIDLATLANRDLASSSTAEEQSNLGDEWWNLAEQQTEERSQQQLRARAVHWYRLATPRLSGLPAAKALKRVESFASETSPFPLNIQGDVLAMVDVAAHASSAEWGRQGAVVGVAPRNSRDENRLVIPISIHGSYELQTKIEWQSRFYSQIQLELPVGDRLVVVDFGRTPAIRTNDGIDKMRIDHPPIDFQNGKIYQLSAKVTQEGDRATVQTMFNGRPYASWHGTISQCLEVSDVRRQTLAVRPPGQNLDEAAFRQSTLAIVGAPVAAFAIGTFQLQLLSGWAEPIAP